MQLPTVSLDFLGTIPGFQKVLLLGVMIGGMAAGFYNLVFLPDTERVESLQEAIGKLDEEIINQRRVAKHLDNLVQVTKQMEAELETKKGQLPPEQEAASLLKQVSDLGAEIGLDFKLWKPGNRSEDASKLFIRLPVSVEVAGSYHTVATFFDKITKLPQIINVSDVRMGSPIIEKDRVVIQTVFELTAYVAPFDQKAIPAKP